ncbi:hypothetical protein A3A84_04105 [Candidatus Collierbacteria bacterium RIFCSPLOWO2_01_FULL_50_23]|nr:MAG: hypothetical protein A3A84_04105 [Candidatus Collierbacteria bacterium RIFCSPLOWO2_01_FULL_50_23]
MKKHLFSVVFGFLLLLATAKVVRANEGVVQLAGKTDADGRCFAVSIYIEGNYKLLLTCRGLTMALDPVLNKYVVWANVAERKQRLGEVVSGKLSGVIAEKFDSLFVTLESDGYPSKPSINMVLNGKVEAIDFGKGTFNSSLVAVAPSVTGKEVKIDERGAVVPTVTQAPPKNLTGAVVAIGKAILFGFIILLIIVGVMSFLARRKNL